MNAKHFFLAGLFFSLLICFTGCTARKVVGSPEERLEAEVRVRRGIPFLDIYGADRQRVVSVRLGMNTSEGSFEKRIKIEAQPQVEALRSVYHLSAGKRSEVDAARNNAVFSLVNADGYRLQVEVGISETGVAFRYRMPGKRNIRVLDDYTAFTFPKEAKGYFLPISEHRRADGSIVPRYEAAYEIGVPITHTSAGHAGWCYPALVQSSAGKQTYWTLLTETAVRGNYCGTHLAEGDSIGNLRIAYPESVKNGRKTVDYPVFNNATPWRVLVVSPRLSDVVENTWATDLATEEFKPTRAYRPGRAAWSWLRYGDEATTYEEQKHFIDLADTLGFEYCLVDACWDVRIGRERMADLAAYAREWGVGLWLWYNCSVDKKGQAKTPKGCLRTHEDRLKEMGWLKSIGVAGIKVNFFGHDQQEALRFYEDLVEDANSFGLAVNLHGAALPRGWERMYPNVLTAEAVMGMERAMVDRQVEDERARHIAMLVFTRNAVAPVDFTPVVLGEQLGMDGGRPVMRSTTAAFELALPVVLHSGVQHYGLVPADLEAFPSFVFDYLTDVPASWDETRLIDGRPGEYAVLARRSGSRWFVAAINGRKQPLRLTLDLSFAGQTHFRQISSRGKNGVDCRPVDASRLLTVEVGVSDGVIFY